MASAYLVSTLVMGVLGLLVIVWMGRARDWASYTPPGARDSSSRLSRLSQSSKAWIVGFAVLVLGITGIVLGVLGGGSLSLVWAVAGALVVGFLVVGTYGAGRSRGHPHAYAIGESVLALGAVFLVVLVGWLLTTFGA